MMLRVQLLQSLPRDVRVDLGRRNIRVPQEQLHHAQIRAVIQKVRRKGMPQGMR